MATRRRPVATSGYEDGTVKVWITSTLQQEGPNLTTDPGATSAVAFALANRGLVAGDGLGDVFTWPMAIGDWEQRACAVAGRNLSRGEWARLVPEIPYAEVCR